jgi:putative ABC transport system permease protein
MVTGNFKIAMDSIKHAKWRSFFTMLGIIIGVVSVVTVVSIGEGVKQQVQGEIDRLGPDLITVRPGKVLERDKSGHIADVPLLNTLVNTPLTEMDLKVATETKNVKTAVPISYLSGTPKAGQRDMPHSIVFGTTSGLPDALKQPVEFGAFFDKDANRNVAVIGKRVAEELFQETVPIGSSMQIRGQSFVVVGVFEEFSKVSFSPDMDYNTAIFIPTAAAKKLNNNQLSVQQILLRPKNTSQTDSVVNDLQVRLLNAHSGQNDFTILKQEDNLAISNSVLNLLTSLITAVAAVSLVVGGIGIMNVMIVSVTERTHEIGIRKAVGATNQQILAQFMIESAVISFVGGVIGVISSILLNFMLRISTDLQPVVTLPIMGVAVLVALVVGIVFGVAPALNASRKDPIEALRRV